MIDVVLDECPQRVGEAASFGRRVEGGHELVEHSLGHGFVQLLLRAEVVVQQRSVDAGFVGYFLQTGPRRRSGLRYPPRQAPKEQSSHSLVCSPSHLVQSV
jgi:hypothetical protein